MMGLERNHEAAAGVIAVPALEGYVSTGHAISYLITVGKTATDVTAIETARPAA